MRVSKGIKSYIESHGIVHFRPPSRYLVEVVITNKQATQFTDGDKILFPHKTVSNLIGYQFIMKPLQKNKKVGFTYAFLEKLGTEK